MISRQNYNFTAEYIRPSVCISVLSRQIYEKHAQMRMEFGGIIELCVRTGRTGRRIYGLKHTDIHLRII